MTHVFNPQNFRKLDNPERRRLLPAKELLKDFGLRTGHIIVDIGAGAGYFALPAKSIVGIKGKVIAVDGSDEMLAMLRKRAQARNKTIQIINAKASATKLPNGFADMVLMAFVLHEVDKKRTVLHEARRLLKPDGTLAVVEWQKKVTRQGPPRSDRISSGEARVLMESEGFKAVAAGKINAVHYAAVGIKV